MKFKMMLKVNTLLTHVLVLALLGSLTFCAPAVQDYGNSVHKMGSNSDPEDAWGDYNAQACQDLGLILLPDGTCNLEGTALDDTPSNCDNPLTTEQSIACNEASGVTEHGGGLWAALLATVGKEVLSVVKDVKDENIHGAYVKSYLRKKLNVTMNGQSFDTDSALEEGILKNHRLFLRNHPTKQGLSSLQFELEAKGDSIATFKKIAYGKTLLLCMNASYARDPDHDNNDNDYQVALQMNSKYNSHDKPATISRADFFTRCNQSTQEQSFIAFQLHNSPSYHVYPYKIAGFHRNGSTYNVEVAGEDDKVMKYYTANNKLELGVSGDTITTAQFIDDDYGINNTAPILTNANPGGSTYESQGLSNFASLQVFFEKFIHAINGGDANERKFCNSNTAKVGCFPNN